MESERPKKSGPQAAARYVGVEVAASLVDALDRPDAEFYEREGWKHLARSWEYPEGDGFALPGQALVDFGRWGGGMLRATFVVIYPDRPVVRKKYTYVDDVWRRDQAEVPDVRADESLAEALGAGFWGRRVIGPGIMAFVPDVLSSEDVDGLIDVLPVEVWEELSGLGWHLRAKLDKSASIVDPDRSLLAIADSGGEWKEFTYAVISKERDAEWEYHTFTKTNDDPTWQESSGAQEVGDIREASEPNASGARLIDHIVGELNVMTPSEAEELEQALPEPFASQLFSADWTTRDRSPHEHYFYFPNRTVMAFDSGLSVWTCDEDQESDIYRYYTGEGWKHDAGARSSGRIPRRTSIREGKNDWTPSGPISRELVASGLLSQEDIEEIAAQLPDAESEAFVEWRYVRQSLLMGGVYFSAESLGAMSGDVVATFDVSSRELSVTFEKLGDMVSTKTVDRQPDGSWRLRPSPKLGDIREGKGAGSNAFDLLTRVFPVEPDEVEEIAVSFPQHVADLMFKDEWEYDPGENTLDTRDGRYVCWFIDDDEHARYVISFFDTLALSDARASVYKSFAPGEGAWTAGTGEIPDLSEGRHVPWNKTKKSFAEVAVESDWLTSEDILGIQGALIEAGLSELVEYIMPTDGKPFVSTAETNPPQELTYIMTHIGPPVNTTMITVDEDGKSVNIEPNDENAPTRWANVFKETDAYGFAKWTVKRSAEIDYDIRESRQIKNSVLNNLVYRGFVDEQEAVEFLEAIEEISPGAREMVTDLSCTVSPGNDDARSEYVVESPDGIRLFVVTYSDRSANFALMPAHNYDDLTFTLQRKLGRWITNKDVEHNVTRASLQDELDDNV